MNINAVCTEPRTKTVDIGCGCSGSYAVEIPAEAYNKLSRKLRKEYANLQEYAEKLRPQHAATYRKYMELLISTGQPQFEICRQEILAMEAN